MIFSRHIPSETSSQGFTLLEVLMAMAIFAIGILAISKLHVRSTFHNTDSRLYTERASNAAGWIESDINLDFGHADLTAGTTVDTSHDRYIITRVITDGVTDPNLSDSDTINMVKRIDITVTSKSTGRVLFTITDYKAKLI